MKKLFLAIAAAGLLAPVLADARDVRQGLGVQSQGQGTKQPRKAPGKSIRGEREKGQERSAGHKSRLTEQERRDLNRDLDRANREIYRR